MALLFMDSFDHYATADFMTKWSTLVPVYSGTDTTGIIAGAGRRGGGALRISAQASSTLVTAAPGLTVASTGNKLVVGFAFAAVNSSTGWNNANTGADAGSFSTPTSLFCARYSGNPHVWVRLNTDGTMSVYRSTSGTVSVFLGTTDSSKPLVQAVYTYIEIAIVFDATVGSVVIRFNGTQVLNLINQNTLGPLAVAAWNAIRLGPFNFSSGGSTAVEVRFDDLYLLDGSGAAPWNTFLGDCRVEAMMPSGAGANTGWAPSAGANWQCVDDAAPNADTDYTAATTAGATDTFATPDLMVAGTTVLGVQHCLSAKKADAGIATIAPVIRSGGVDYPGADLAPNTGYSVLRQVAQVNPGTAVQWTMADFNAAEFGYRRTA